MSGPAFVRMYPSDWRSGCLGLNLEQEGLYVRICMFIAEVGRRVPLDDSQAARMLNCQTKQYRRILGELLVLGKVKRHDDGYGNDRIELERRKAANAKYTAATERSSDWEADQGQDGEDTSPAMNGKSSVKVDQIGGETELKLERNSIETELQLPVPPKKIMENQCPSKRTKSIVKESEEEGSPLHPQNQTGDGWTNDPFFKKCKLALNGSTEHMIETVRQATAPYGSRASAAETVAEMIDAYGAGPLSDALRWHDRKIAAGEKIRDPVKFISSTARTNRDNARGETAKVAAPKKRGVFELLQEAE